MKSVQILLLILCVVSAENPPSRHKTINLTQLGVSNVTSLNAESSQRIVMGDIYGNLFVFAPSTSQITDIQPVHNASILKIQSIQLANYSGYITIDTSGHIVLWNTDMSAIQQNKYYFPAIVGAAVTTAVLNERGRKDANKHYVLAFGTQDYIYEYCVNSRQLRRNITSPTIHRFLSIAYIGQVLYASVQNDGLYAASQNDLEFQPVANENGYIGLLTAHEQSDFYEDDGLAVLNQTALMHFSRDGLSKRIQSFYYGMKITSLNQCWTRDKREKQDLYAVGFEDGTILVRGGERTFQTYVSGSRIQAIQCDEDQLIYINESNTLVSIQLDHLEHKRPKFSGTAGILLAIVVLAILGRDIMMKTEEGAEDGSEMELQERVYQPPS